MTEDIARQLKEAMGQLKKWEDALHLFESNVASFADMGFDNDYWKGRRDALADIREKVYGATNPTTDSTTTTTGA